MSGGPRRNRAKQKLRLGEPVLIPWLGANSIPDLDTLDQLGTQHLFDAVWAEMEHGPWSWRELGDISRVCDLHGLTSLVRVSQNEPSVIGRALDRGVQGVLVPHVRTVIDARHAVGSALFGPQGNRGIGGARQGYGVSDYPLLANAEIMVVLMIEDEEGIANLPEMLDVEGVDCFFFGPADLAQSMGLPGQTGHRKVQGAIRQAIERVVEHGGCAGTVVSDATLEEHLELGTRLLRYSGIGYMQSGLRSFQEKIAGLTKKTRS